MSGYTINHLMLQNVAKRLSASQKVNIYDTSHRLKLNKVLWISGFVAYEW